MNFSKKNYSLPAPALLAIRFGVKLQKSNRIVASKNLITTITLFIVFIMSVNAQLVIDDFTTGTVEKLTFKDATNQKYIQSGSSIIGKMRQISAKVIQNPFAHNMQLSIKNDLLVMSYAYDTRGTTYVNYGVDKNGNQPLNLDVSKYKKLKIEFEAKSTINGLYVSLFTSNDRAVFSKHVPAREGKLIFEVPLKDFRKIGKKFTLSDIDYIRFQFDSRSKTGCNMAINKIWFE